MKMTFNEQGSVFRMIFTEDQLPLLSELMKEWQLYRYKDQLYFEFQRSDFEIAVAFIQSFSFNEEDLPVVFKVIDRLQNPRPDLRIVH